MSYEEIPLRADEAAFLLGDMPKAIWPDILSVRVDGSGAEIHLQRERMNEYAQHIGMTPTLRCVEWTDRDGPGRSWYWEVWIGKTRVFCLADPK